MHLRHKFAVLVVLISCAFAVPFTRPGSQSGSESRLTSSESMSCRKKSGVAASLDGNAENSAGKVDGGMTFGRFRIAPSQIFYRSATGLTAGIVNLRPIVDGHVLLVPMRVVPLLSDLTEEEYQDLWSSVRSVQAVLGAQYNCPGFNVAVQDGPTAGQTVPHVHVHILPRCEGDFDRNDDVYDELEAWAPRVNDAACEKGLYVPGDDQRRDRTLEEMEAESMLYRSILAKTDD